MDEGDKKIIYVEHRFGRMLSTFRCWQTGGTWHNTPHRHLTHIFPKMQNCSSKKKPCKYDNLPWQKNYNLQSKKEKPNVCTMEIRYLQAACGVFYDDLTHSRKTVKPILTVRYVNPELQHVQYDVPHMDTIHVPWLLPYILHLIGFTTQPFNGERMYLTLQAYRLVFLLLHVIFFIATV